MSNIVFVSVVMFSAECQCKRFSVRRGEMKKSWRWRRCKSCKSNLVVTHETMGLVCDHNERRNERASKIKEKKLNQVRNCFLSKCVNVVVCPSERSVLRQDVFMGVYCPYNTPQSESIELSDIEKPIELSDIEKPIEIGDTWIQEWNEDYYLW